MLYDIFIYLILYIFNINFFNNNKNVYNKNHFFEKKIEPSSLLIIVYLSFD